MSGVEGLRTNREYVMKLPRLYAIVDAARAARSGWDPVDLARAYLAGGARLVQLRAENVSSGLLLEWTDAIVDAARAVGATVIVNNRADVAKLAGADGVHVGQDDLPVRSVRALLGDAAVVGLSTHTSPQVDLALAEPAAYLAVGPVYGTRTKDTGYTALGLEFVREAARKAGARPVVAIGGIDLDRAGDVIRAGAASVAVISDLMEGDDPQARTRAYIDVLERL